MKTIQFPIHWLVPRGGFEAWANSITTRPEPEEKVTLNDALRQLQADLIGKDSHRGVTLSYTWLANQFGHFGLGFIPTIVLVLAFNGREQALQAALLVSCLWTAFEIFNFLGPLLLQARTLCFAPAWRNIAFDTLTDILFFVLGAFTAALSCQATPASAIVVGCTAVALIPMCCYWYPTKIYLQRAGFPAQVRLGQWTGIMPEAERSIVQQFVRSEGRGQHLLIFGNRLADASALGVAAATEHAIRHRSSSYLRASQWLSQLADQPQERDSSWHWTRVSTIVIDECCTSSGRVPAATVAEMLSANPDGAAYRKALRSRNVIWVLGADPDGSQRNSWTGMLHALGVSADRIHCVETGNAGAAASGQDMVVVGEGDQVGQALHVKASV